MDFLIASRILTFGISLHRSTLTLQLGRLEFYTLLGDDGEGGDRFQHWPGEFSFRLRETRFFFTRHESAQRCTRGWAAL